MSGPRLFAAMACLASLAACGGGGQDERAEQPPAESELATVTTAADSAGANSMVLMEASYQGRYPEAGFTVFWPSGCGRLSEQISSRPTPRAQQEFIYTCDRDRAGGLGVSIRVYHDAEHPDGAAPDPALVTSLVQRQLQRSGTRILRQRPLAAEDLEGVDVHAGDPGGPGEVWVRGLLSGSHIYLLTARNMTGGLFEDPEVVDFFASFRILDR